MQRFRDVTDATARKIDRRMSALAACDTLADLEGNFLEESAKILPADCLCWNNWTLDWSGVITFRTNADYGGWLTRHQAIFDQVVGHHPVIAAGFFPLTEHQVLRMSDFQSQGAFRENPLYRDVYRHLDSQFQVCYTVSTLSDRKILLTWNRRAREFTDRDMQTFHYMGQRLGVVSRRIAERERLHADWRMLCDFVDARLPADSVGTLGPGDARLLAHLLKHGSRAKVSAVREIRRDTIDKQLGSIREKLGLENHHQLLSAFAELRAHAEKHPPGKETGTDEDVS